MKRPLIGINTDITFHQDGTMLHTLRAPYVDAVRKAGGIPFLIPSVDPEGATDFLERLDGLLMTGGDDLDPRTFGKEERHPDEVPLDPRREAFDLVLIRRAVELELPLLCVCLGMQELAVVFEGTIHQSIADGVEGAVAHRVADGSPARHEIRLAEGSFLRKVLGPAVMVNSLHRQAVASPGKGLTVTALAPDGVIEGIETTEGRFAVGVQWHPELIADDGAQGDLFGGFVDFVRRR